MKTAHRLPGWIRTGVLAAFVLSSAGYAEAAAPKVAVARVKGPRRTAPDKLGTGLRAGLRATGATVMEVGAANPKKAGFLDEAKKAEADYLVVVKLRSTRKRRFATARLFDVKSGEKVEEIKKAYRRSSEAGKIGSRLGDALGKAAQTALDNRRPTPIKPKVAAAPPTAPSDPAPGSTPATTVRSEPEDDFSDINLGGKEDAFFTLTVGGGVQAGSAYTVAVGGDVTGLAYTLNPLFLTAVNASFLSSFGLGGEVWLRYAPVQYQVDVNPPVDPADPSGQFIDVGGAVKYRLKLTELGDTGAMYLTLLVGVGYGSMTAQEQGQNSVVVSYSGVDVHGGLRLTVALTEDLVVELETRDGAVVTYSEGPVTTGESGSGFQLNFGGGARYWLTDIFGVHLGLNYRYQRVGLSNLGTRLAFEDDPQLLDATVFNGDFKVHLGVQLAL